MLAKLLPAKPGAEQNLEKCSENACACSQRRLGGKFRAPGAEFDQTIIQLLADVGPNRAHFGRDRPQWTIRGPQFVKSWPIWVAIGARLPRSAPRMSPPTFVKQFPNVDPSSSIWHSSNIYWPLPPNGAAAFCSSSTSLKNVSENGVGRNPGDATLSKQD